MSGFINFIFKNVDVAKLDKNQVITYIKYIDDMIQQGLTIKRQKEYLEIRIQLVKRLLELESKH